jgi:hypothetical protein
LARVSRYVVLGEVLRRHSFGGSHRKDKGTVTCFDCFECLKEFEEFVICLRYLKSRGSNYVEGKGFFDDEVNWP